MGKPFLQLWVLNLDLRFITENIFNMVRIQCHLKEINAYLQLERIINSWGVTLLNVIRQSNSYQSKSMFFYEQINSNDLFFGNL